MEFFFGTFTSEWEQRRAALLHEMSHAANGPDQQIPAGERTSLCKECVSHAPLLAMAGGVRAGRSLSYCVSEKK